MIITFGKYKNKQLSEIPDDYLKWGAENLTNNWKDHFKTELVRRSGQKIFKTHDSTFQNLSDKKDPLVFGRDSTEKIVNISIKNDTKYTYFSDGSLKEDEYQHMYLNAERKGKRLEGPHFYNYIDFVNSEQYKYLEESYSKLRWLPRSKEEGWMLHSGQTYFKGMKFEELKVLSFDIETTTFNPKDKDANILLVSSTYTILSSGCNKSRLFDINSYTNNVELLRAFCDYVKELNPDIIIGHNIFSFDLPYMNHFYPLTLGRNGEPIEIEDKVSKFRKDGSQQYEYNNIKVHGREVCDTFFLSMKYDLERKFPSYGLKAIEKHLKIVPEDRIEWDFKKNPTSDMLKTDEVTWKSFVKYCEQDSESPIKLFEKMAPPFFYMTQSVPKTFQQMINEASGSQLDAVMIRSYLQDGKSIPKTSQKEEFQGAISYGKPGIYRNVRKVDVVSLYPSIMLQYNIYDKEKDPNQHLLKILKYFRDERIKNKDIYKKTNDRYYDDLQAAQKIFINSIYGFLGAKYLLYNYPEGSTAVTKYGREILQKAVKWATGTELEQVVKKVRNQGKENEETDLEWKIKESVDIGAGYELVNCDTDSISYTNGQYPSKDEFKKEIDLINSYFDELIKFDDDGVFDAVVVIRAKNYILRKKDQIKIKGSAVTDQKKEPALREMLELMVNELIYENREDVLIDIYEKYVNEAKNISDINRWCVKKTVTEKVYESTRQNETKIIDAINEGIETKTIKPVQEGDKIYLYQAIDGQKQKMVKGEPQFYKKTGLPMMVENAVLRLPELWKKDHDVAHYLKRVHDTASILKNVINIAKFKKHE